MVAMSLETAKGEIVTSVELGKALFTYQIRNEWYDWNGNSSLMHRPSGFTMTLDEAKGWAEKARVQGSRFRLEEIPIIYAKGKSISLVLSERKSSRPLEWYAARLERLHGPLTIASLVHLGFPQKKHSLICHVWKGHEAVTPTDGQYASRDSTPGKGNNSLGWRVTTEKVDDSSIRAIVAALSSAVGARGILHKSI